MSEMSSAAVIDIDDEPKPDRLGTLADRRCGEARNRGEGAEEGEGDRVGDGAGGHEPGGREWSAMLMDEGRREAENDGDGDGVKRGAVGG